MENRFEIFNRQYFQGQLPKPGFTLSRARTQLGQCRCRYKKRGLWQRNKLESCVIALSTYYDMEEREACNVLLHEMIHYYIAHNQLKDTSAHGRLFRQIAQSLNARWGWQVSVKTSVEGWALAQPQKNTTETFLILAVETSGGACYLRGDALLRPQARSGNTKIPGSNPPQMVYFPGRLFQRFPQSEKLARQKNEQGRPIANALRLPALQLTGWLKLSLCPRRR